ncbi:MAG: TetR/AcrR family transcriptional regulator [Thermodesulfovibrionales bacterium]
MGKKDTETRLLEATLRLISEKGYLGATTREIAQDAGVSELTLFRHFGSKDNLFEEMLNKYTFLPRLKELLPELKGMSYDEALIIIGTRFLETLKERKSLIKIMYAEINLYPGKIREVYFSFVNEIIQTLAGYFRELQKKKELRDFDPVLAARAFMGMILSYFKAEEIVKGKVISKKAVKTTVETFVDIFVNGTVHK